MTDGSKQTYVEPTVIWRLHHSDGRLAHGTVVPRWHDAAAVWFINNLPEGGCDFHSWSAALNWLENVRSTLLRNGWESSP